MLFSMLLGFNEVVFVHFFPLSSGSYLLYLDLQVAILPFTPSAGMVRQKGGIVTKCRPPVLSAEACRALPGSITFPASHYLGKLILFELVPNSP